MKNKCTRIETGKQRSLDRGSNFLHVLKLVKLHFICMCIVYISLLFLAILIE